MRLEALRAQPSSERAPLEAAPSIPFHTLALLLLWQDKRPGLEWALSMAEVALQLRGTHHSQGGWKHGAEDASSRQRTTA